MKSYEDYANDIASIMEKQETEVKKIENAANQVAVDVRYSDYGREEHIKGLKSDLEGLNKDYSDNIRKTVKGFCNDYGVSFAEDGKDHGTDIANALQVIEMCGSGITPDLFRSVLEPLKGSYKALKIVNDVLSVKWENQAVGDRYDPKIREIIRDYIGSNEEVNDYVNYLNDIAEVIDMPILTDYSLVNTGMNGVSRFEVQNKTRYAVEALPGEIKRLGGMYKDLALRYPLLFSNYIPSDDEKIDDEMKNNS